MSENGKRIQVKAPISGVFFRAPSPEARPFVEVDSRVEKGQTLALLEAMKLFTKVKSPVSGRVAEIPRVDAETVDAGTVLFSIERVTG